MLIRSLLLAAGALCATAQASDLSLGVDVLHGRTDSHYSLRSQVLPVTLNGQERASGEGLAIQAGLALAPHWQLVGALEDLGRARSIKRACGMIGCRDVALDNHVRALRLGVEASLPLSGNLSVHGQAGAAWMRVHQQRWDNSGIAVDRPPEIVPVTHSGVGAAWQLGLGYAFSPQLSARVGYGGLSRVGGVDWQGWRLGLHGRF
ncbi:outer membrane protein [Massilia sp. TS11]|uniref:outer membrane protein n=1 Tax=Massilia sp. TS11 TaxID=2908003 RepID=UPI001EDA7DB3|nr:outer membrane beta-barrel protein [Massilia sp. TS11]MCG2584854.1 porin family protein [Massilia sp. TS11]